MGDNTQIEPIELEVPVTDQDHMKGAPDAPLTLVEYADYQCEGCIASFKAVEKLLETRRRVAEVCLKNGKLAGTVATPANARELIDMGYRFINIGADVIGLSQYCKTVIAAFDAAVGR